MDTMPPITMSSLDHQRLERLLESDAVQRLPGIDALAAEIDRAAVVPPREVPPDVVTMNSTIRFRDDTNGHEFELTLVYPPGASTEIVFGLPASGG